MLTPNKERMKKEVARKEKQASEKEKCSIPQQKVHNKTLMQNILFMTVPSILTKLLRRNSAST